MKELIKNAQNIEIIGKLVGLCGIIYSMILFIYDNIYKQQCEEFFKIPAKYFQGNLNEKIMYLFCIGGLILAVIYPIRMRERDKRENHETRKTLLYYFIYVIVLGIYTSALNIIFLMAILNIISEKFFLFCDDHSRITMTFVCIITYVGLIGMMFIDKIKLLKKLRKILLLVVRISAVMDILLMVGSSMCVLSRSIEDRVNYEIININTKKYVVLSEYEDKILVVPLEIKNTGEYIFKTKNYKFIDRSQGIFNYVQLKDTPQIE